MEKKPISHFIAGTIISAVSIILFLVYYFAGIAFERNIYSWIPALVTIALVIYFVLQYGKANDNNVTFGNLFGFGFKTTAIFALIMTVFMAIIVYAVPDYKVKFMEAMNSQMDNQVNLSEEQKETALNITEKFFNISFIGGALFMNILIGTIASLIGAAIAKKNPSSPFNNQV